MTKRLSATIVLSLILAFGAIAPASAMTPDYASQYYLNSVCPTIPAWNRVIQTALPGEPPGPRKPGQGPTPAPGSRRAPGVCSARTSPRLSHLTNTPSEWPTPEAASATNKVAIALLRERLVIAELRTRSRGSFARYWNRVFLPQDHRVVSYWRLAMASLSIPPNGNLGC